MKKVKTVRADLEKRRFGFFKVGMIVSCSLALLAFRWTTYEYAEPKSQVQAIELDQTVIQLPPISFQEKVKKSKPKIEIFKGEFEITKKKEKLGKSFDPFDEDDIWMDDDGTDCEDCDVLDPDLNIGNGESDWMKIERTPYYDDCASPANKKKESECTYAEIRNFVQSHTEYPSAAREAGFEGTVWVTFLINKKGEVQDAEIIKSPHFLLSNAALEGVNKLPKMNPGTQRHNPVKVRLQIPIKFALK